MRDEARTAWKDQTTWFKLPPLLLFYLLLVIVTPVLILVSFVGWVILLVTGERSEGVTEFGQNLAKWYSQTARYVTGGAERRPFPFEDLDCPRDEPSKTSRAGAASRAGSSVPAAGSVPETAPPDQSSAMTAPATAPGSKAASKTSAARKSPVRKAGSKKAGSKKSSKKSPGKKAGSKQSAGKKSSSKKSAGKKKTGTDESAPAATRRSDGTDDGDSST